MCIAWKKKGADYLIYKGIRQLASNSFAASSQNWFDAEIDETENGKLVEDITKKVLHKYLRNRQDGKMVN